MCPFTSFWKLSRAHPNLYIQAEKREGELARKKANQDLYEAEMASAASSKGIMGSKCAVVYS